MYNMDGKTTQDLVNILTLNKKVNYNSQIPSEDYRYVIYSRKSTESEERQIRSLGDQISECKELAKGKNLKVIKIIQEAESAKEPDIRPKFRQMLDDFKSGKYQGLIAWHPDRLARNMKDAGEIIDLIDKDIIKDVKFVSFNFEKNTAGKMLLGISFVLSKQYSDQLSDNVRRGIVNSIKEGKYVQKAKHGYCKDINGFLRPDVDSFLLLKEAFYKRIEGETLDKISTYLNNNNYKRSVGINKYKEFQFNKTRLSTVFRDPFYAGVLQYGEDTVDLTTVYDFVPMITPDEFFQINKINDFKQAFQMEKVRERSKTRANFLRGMVFCGYCHSKRVVALTTKKLKSGEKRRYYNFRCDNKVCSHYGKSDRAKYVIDFVLSNLKNDTLVDLDKGYNLYVHEIKHQNGDNLADLESKNKSVIANIKVISGKIRDIKDLILEKKEDLFVRNSFKEDLKEKEKQLAELNKCQKELKEEINKGKHEILSMNDFIELFHKVPLELAQTRYLERRDFIIRKIYLNFTIKDKQIVSYQLKPPFDLFIKGAKNLKVSNGRDDWT